MDIFTKEGIIYYVQVDHLSGENLGQIIHYLYESGASNVQVIPTITKKNRPGHLFLIDCQPKNNDKIEKIVARELTSGGWHKINTEHRHLSTEIIKREVTIKLADKTFPFVTVGKKIGEEGMNLRPEHQNCLDLKNEIYKNFSHHISLSQSNFYISEILNHTDKKEISIMADDV